MDATTTNSGIYQRGKVFWGRTTISGKVVRWSLRTSDAKIARQRFERLKREAMNAGIQTRGQTQRKKQLVYFIAQNKHVKIGFTHDLERRLKDLQLASAEPLILLFTEKGGPRRELELHLQFSHLRTHGEWFRFEGELLVYCERRLGPSSLLLNNRSHPHGAA